VRVLLELVEAVRGRRPVAFGYTSRHGRVRERNVQPYGVVAHRGLLYLTGFDLTRRAARTFRVDRIADLRRLEGTFTRPTDTDDDPVNQVRGPLSAAPDRHPVSVRIRTDVSHVRTLIPEMLASVTPLPAAEDGEGWLRVFLHAERLDWVAGRLAAIDRPFVIEYPQALCNNVFALGQRLITASQRESDAVTEYSSLGAIVRRRRARRHLITLVFGHSGQPTPRGRREVSEGRVTGLVTAP
jgi:predicted DNA-binding transcriptional regulator YafY